MRSIGRLTRGLPLALVSAAAAAMAMYGPISQPADYHQFADGRAALGVHNGADVFSNVGFALVGLWGLARLWPDRDRPALAPGWAGYRLFLAALVLTALGSGYYHLAPDNARLVWDRLPIALACAGLLAAVHAEATGRRDSGMPTGLLAIAAFASVAWWYMTERLGAGDLRPYLLLQGAPIVLIPMWQAIHRAPRADRIAFDVAILLYLAAKAAEVCDHQIFAMLGIVSGHTLKHLLATAAAWVVVARLVRRSRT